MKRSFAILFTAVAAIVCIGISVQAQETAQPTQQSAIPVPEGAQVTIEAAMDHDQIMSQIDMMTAFAPPSLGQLDINALKLAIDPIKYVQYAQMSYRTEDTPSRLIAFFESEIRGRRIIYDIGSLSGGGVMAGFIMIATQDNGYFAAMITPPPADDKDTEAKGSIQAFRMFGSPNVGQLVKAAMPILMNMSVLKTSTQPINKTTTPAKKPSTTTKPTTKPTTTKRR